MRRLLLASVAATMLAVGSVQAAGNAATIRGCIEAAARAYRVPPAILVVLLNVEGGSLGAVSPNTNGTVDIGPMQVNQIWLPQVAAHWGTTEHQAYLGLRDNFCANIEAGTWILRQAVDEANGNFWDGVGYYHSHNPFYERNYLKSVLQQVLRLEARHHAALERTAAAAKG